MNDNEPLGGSKAVDGIDPHRQPRSGLERFAWLPVPLLLAAIIAARAAGLGESYENDALRLVLSFTFYTLVSLGTLFLIGRSFLTSGLPGLLLLECGVVLWSLAGTVGDIVDRGDANINVTIFNTGILLAGLCHLAGAILALRPQRPLHAKPLWLGASCALALGVLGLVTWATLAHWLPVFFIPGQGGTTVRYYVLISATAMFVLSAVLLYAGQRAARPPFASWYSLALLLLAVGLFGIMIQLSLWSVVNWLSRTAQWLAGFYLLLAAIAALRESNLPLLPLGEKSRPALYRDTIAVVMVLAAAAVRLVFLQAMGPRVPFATFYPAVILAALYGGRRAGLLATALSAILADYFWIEPTGSFALGQPADWLGLVIFLLTGAMVAWITEAMHRAHTQAAAAEEQAKHATERAEAAAALRQIEERLALAASGTRIGMFDRNVATGESLCTEQHARLVGLRTTTTTTTRRRRRCPYPTIIVIGLSVYIPKTFPEWNPIFAAAWPSIPRSRRNTGSCGLTAACIGSQVAPCSSTTRRIRRSACSASSWTSPNANGQRRHSARMRRVCGSRRRAQRRDLGLEGRNWGAGFHAGTQQALWSTLRNHQDISGLARSGASG